MSLLYAECDVCPDTSIVSYENVRVSAAEKFYARLFCRRARLFSPWPAAGGRVRAKAAGQDIAPHGRFVKLGGYSYAFCRSGRRQRTCFLHLEGQHSARRLAMGAGQQLEWRPSHRYGKFRQKGLEHCAHCARLWLNYQYDAFYAGCAGLSFSDWRHIDRRFADSGGEGHYWWIFFHAVYWCRRPVWQRQIMLY